MTTHHYDTVVVGGGQAGLATGYHLARTGRSFVILDASKRVGDAWRSRWDSLRLFTPARGCGLPGMPFPLPKHVFPTRDQMAGYLEDYARDFALPVVSAVRVDAVGHDGGRFIVAAGDARYLADNVVIASGAFHRPHVPAFADELDPRIAQMHSSGYQRPAQLGSDRVLVVGAGNSGVDIALDVATEHETLLAGEHPGHVPIHIDRLDGRLLFPVLWQFWTRVLHLGTPVGRAMRPKILAKSEPLIRHKPGVVAAAGIERTPRVVGVRDGLPLLADGRVLEVDAVIWATGFRPDFGWIDVPFERDEFGEPVTKRGVVPGAPGLYFVARPFLYGYSSHIIGGVGADAAHVVADIAARTPAGMPEAALAVA